MVYAKRVGDGERSMIQVVNKALLSFMTKWTLLCQSGWNRGLVSSLSERTGTSFLFLRRTLCNFKK